MKEALGWAGRQLASPVVGHQRLVGGMTSTMLALDHADGSRSVLRLMAEQPWRTHGAALTARERAALLVLADTPVPAPRSLALDAAGSETGVSAHLMTFLPGRPLSSFDGRVVEEMARTLATIYGVVPDEPFRTFQSWAPPEKWVVPSWSAQPDAWRWAFDVLAGAQPAYEPCLVHRDFGHRNLLWLDGRVSGVVGGVVDWVETSSGPRWLDAGHAATNLAVAGSPGAARAVLDAYAAASGTPVEPYWLVMDAVGFLPFPDGPALFSSDEQHARLDAWVGWLAQARHAWT